MDLLSIFEALLKTEESSSANYVRQWDERADRYYQGQLKQGQSLAKKVVNLLLDKKILHDQSSVLDIGAGAGRYTIQLAKHAKEVHAVDFSSKMLDYLALEKEKHALDHISMSQVPWPPKKPLAQVDLAFSAMCPCTRSIEAIEAMNQVAKEYAVIAQMTKMSDNVTDGLIEESLIEAKPNDPHNNRRLAQSYFNILWELGYEAEVNYITEEERYVVDPTEAVKDYHNRYQDLDKEILKDYLLSLATENQLEVCKQTKMAVISWSII